MMTGRGEQENGGVRGRWFLGEEEGVERRDYDDEVEEKTHGVWVETGNGVRWVPEARRGREKEGVGRRDYNDDVEEGRTHGVWAETGNGVRWVPEARRGKEGLEKRSYDGRGIEEMGDDELEELLWWRL